MDKEIINKIKEQVLITDICSDYGLTVIPSKARGKLTLKEHDSVFIYPQTNSFYRYATGIGGDVIKFMEAIPEINIDFKKAVKLLAPRVNVSLATKTKENTAVKTDKYSTSKNSLTVQKQTAVNLSKQINFDDNVRSATAYLIKTRKIDNSIVDYLVKEGCIAQDNINGRKSVLFIGHNEKGMIATCCKRSTNPESTFKTELKGCDYSYGYLIDMDVSPRKAYLSNGNLYKKDKQLFCFESYIDMLSFMTLQKQHNIDISQNAYLSCASATKYKTILSVQERNGYQDIKVCFDNDEAGNRFSKKAKEELEKKGCSVNSLISINKDWNEDLVTSKQGINASIERALKKQNIAQKQNSNNRNKILDKEI